jgi:hypothetical protein
MRSLTWNVRELLREVMWVEADQDCWDGDGRTGWWMAGWSGLGHFASIVYGIFFSVWLSETVFDQPRVFCSSLSANACAHVCSVKTVEHLWLVQVMSHAVCVRMVERLPADASPRKLLVVARSGGLPAARGNASTTKSYSTSRVTAGLHNSSSRPRMS